MTATPRDRGCDIALERESPTRATPTFLAERFSRSWPRSGGLGAPRPYRIDIHCHFAPQSWVAELPPKRTVWPAPAKWTPAKHLEDMDQAIVAVSLVSITTAGLQCGCI